MATVNEPQDNDLRVPLREYIKLGFDNINARLDDTQRERAVLKSDIDRVSGRVDKVDGRIDRLMFAIIAAPVELSAAIIGAAAAIIATQ
ncbi:MAG: hypothetical protein OXG80_00855 [Chloroflexi bacterium]|nr:hypothetical protein [Chloroflexota bacterium]